MYTAHTIHPKRVKTRREQTAFPKAFPTMWACRAPVTEHTRNIFMSLHATVYSILSCISKSVLTFMFVKLITRQTTAAVFAVTIEKCACAGAADVIRSTNTRKNILPFYVKLTHDAMTIIIITRLPSRLKQVRFHVRCPNANKQTCSLSTHVSRAR